jgi:hypothetical protein
MLGIPRLADRLIVRVIVYAFSLLALSRMLGRTGSLPHCQQALRLDRVGTAHAICQSLPQLLFVALYRLLVLLELIAAAAHGLVLILPILASLGGDLPLVSIVDDAWGFLDCLAVSFLVRLWTAGSGGQSGRSYLLLCFLQGQLHLPCSEMA